MPHSPGLQTQLPFEAGANPNADGQAPRLSEWDPEHWPVAPDWRALVDRFLASATGLQLGHFMYARLAGGALIYPPQPFRALALTALAQVRVLVLGQDPYHGPGQAEGLAFSVAPGVKAPPSLRNIFKEIARDPLCRQSAGPVRADGSLLRWAQQGVLLLNTCLTVEQGQPASHAQQGWEVLTDEIVRTVALKKEPVVFMLWGAQAQAKQALIAAASAARRLPPPAAHLVLCANHPSPLSALRAPRPFLGCGHFGQVNAFLRQHGGPQIDW